MKPETLAYIKGRVISTTPSLTGDITTHSTVVFDNGVSIEGHSIREINNYDAKEAEEAAFKDAIESLSPGVEFILSKIN